MAKIHNTRAKVYETRSFVSEEPTEHVESEGERLIKEMVQKQLDTNLSLEEELNRKRNFQTVTEFVPLTEYTSGESSLKEFKESAEKVALIEELKILGLSKDEILLVLDSKTEDFLAKYKNAEKTILSSRLLAVLDKIEQARKESESKKQKSSSSGGSRHERELALCVKPESKHTKLVNFALSCQKPKEDPRPMNHPINHLKNIEENLFGHLTRKRKNVTSRVQKFIKKSSIEKSKDTLKANYSYKGGSSLWDVKSELTNSAVVPEKSSRLQHYIAADTSITRRVYTCKAQPEYLYTIRDNQIVPYSKPKVESPICEDNKTDKSGTAYVVPDYKSCGIKLVPFDEISKNRLSVEEIRSISRFENYQEGSPSQVLYIKNLSGAVTKEDLVSLFGHFEEENKSKIMYRLMTGKMKGQAFITFAANGHAKKALEAVNGFILKGKPLVIQYGKGSSNGE